MADCYEVEGQIEFNCRSCNTKWRYEYLWKSTDIDHMITRCRKCLWPTIFEMKKLLSDDWGFYEMIIRNEWNYTNSEPENKEAIEGKVVWV